MNEDAGRLRPSQDGKAAPHADAAARTLVWDLPLRLFHWALVASVATLVVTGERGEAMDLHGRFGIAAAGLVAFRIAWGFLGSTHSRFAQFAPTPQRMAAYLRGHWKDAGHNPLGACSVFAMLTVLAALAVTGIFSSDDVAFSGPWYAQVSDDVSARLTAWHGRLADALFALVGLHVLAIAYYSRVKGERLVPAMVHGRKSGARRPAAGGGLRALLVSLLVGLLASFAADHAIWAPAAASAATAARSSPPLE